MGAGRRALFNQLGKQSDARQSVRPSNLGTGECTPCKAKAAEKAYSGKITVAVGK